MRPLPDARPATQACGDKTDASRGDVDHTRTHALEGTGGKTYAELDREDPAREGVMTGSFLRASLFTSVVAFGVATMAFGLGIGLILIGLALTRTARALT